jgi:hypothetical protein
LPTEAEWEYACRAGTDTAYFTGNELPLIYWKNQQLDWFQQPVSLSVADTPPNPWGLYDMHGNVEEWCHDWYGQYPIGIQQDPVGRVDGQFKVSRGGSHGTPAYFLRSANRMGSVPSDKHWMIGFRVVMAEWPSSEPLANTRKPLNMREVSQEPCDWTIPADPNTALFEGPVRFYEPPPPGSYPQDWPNSHASTITWCPNGDLLLCWVTNFDWREIYTVASRWRLDRSGWEPASVFFYPPDRDGSGGALLNDGNGKIIYMRGISASAKWATLAGMVRSSTNSGSDWSAPHLVYPEHGDGQFYHAHFGFKASDGDLVMIGDGGYLDEDGSFMHVSEDGGATWHNPGYGTPEPNYIEGGSGGRIAGIHAAAVERADGSFLAFGRKNNINGMMPKSVSTNKGRSWTYSASAFPPLQGGQRPVMLRLNEGPIVLFSFSNLGMLAEDAIGKNRLIFGLFAAVSYDEGLTWPVIKPVTRGNPPKQYDGGGHTGLFTMDETHAEPAGYLSCTQSPDGTIHLVSSGLYYRFNLNWLMEPMPASDIDDMECYSPAGSTLINSAWQSGGGASIAVETDYVHWGSQAMRLDYDNRHQQTSYATVTYASARDWARFNFTSLDLWFYCDPDNTPAPFYVTLRDATGKEATYLSDKPDQIQEAEWQAWRIDLTAATIDLGRVESFYLGVGDPCSIEPEGQVGSVIFDDIRLYAARCLPDVPLKGDVNGDCTVDLYDLAEFMEDYPTSGLWPASTSQ